MDIFDLAPLAAPFGSLAAGVVAAVTLGFFIGIVSAAMGIGGGFLITPFCHSVLQLPAGLAVATSMGQIPLMSLSGVLRYARAGIIDYRLAAGLLLTALPAAQLVAAWLAGGSSGDGPRWFGLALPDLLLIVVFTFAIGGVGLVNLLRAARPRAEADSVSGSRRPALALTLLVGAVFGGLSALLGIGGGFFAVPYFMYVCGLSPVAAVATSLFAVFVTSAVTTAHYLWAGQIHFGISLVLASGSIAGAQLGARTALRLAPRTLLAVMGGMQLAACAGYLALRLG